LERFDSTASWSKTNRALKIDNGLIMTDKNRNLAGRALQITGRFTWEIHATIAGNGISHFRNVIGDVDRVGFFGGATIVDNSNGNGNGRWGMTVGSYINTSRIRDINEENRLLMHEYGHVLQSQIMGPFYLRKVGAASLVSATFQELNVFNHNHDFTWFEISANRLAFNYLNKHYTEPPKSSTADTWRADNREFSRRFSDIDWRWFMLFNPVIF